MQKIQLTNSKDVVLVDDQDFATLNATKWHKHTNGYARAGFCKNGKKFNLTMHRLVAGRVKGDGILVDHINGNILDNRRENLRLCNKAENSRNRAKNNKGTSRYKGVYWAKIKKVWMSYIKLDKKQIYLGYFKSEIEAGKAYDKKALELFGEFAKLNFPIGSQVS